MNIIHDRNRLNAQLSFFGKVRLFIKELYNLRDWFEAEVAKMDGTGKSDDCELAY